VEREAQKIAGRKGASEKPQPSHPRVAAAFCIRPVQMIKKSEKGFFD